MKNISTFQLIFLGIFFVALLVGFVILLMTRGVVWGGDKLPPTNIMIWGVLPQNVVTAAISVAKQMPENENLILSYQQKPENTFDKDLVEAIATGRGPDVILVRQDSIITNLNKIITVPYDSFPARVYRDTFIEEGDMLMVPSGLVAVPFAIDPMVMYWNRDLFSRAGIANPPRYWDEVFAITEKLTKKDASGTILQSAAGLGEYANIKNAREILSSMFLQAGNTITMWNSNYSSVDVAFTDGSAKPESVLAFYTQFSDSRKPVNTWSRALPDSESMFLGNRLGMYFGFASELETLKEKSPNLNFDVAALPQSRNGTNEGAFGRLYNFMILRTTNSVPGAIQSIVSLVSKPATESMLSLTGLSSVRKDYRPPSGDAYRAVFAQSALTARGWIDPDPIVSSFAFKDIIETVTSGFSDANGALGKAVLQMQAAARRQ